MSKPHHSESAQERNIANIIEQIRIGLRSPYAPLPQNREKRPAVDNLHLHLNVLAPADLERLKALSATEVYAKILNGDSDAREAVGAVFYAGQWPPNRVWNRAVETAFEDAMLKAKSALDEAALIGKFETLHPERVDDSPFYKSHSSRILEHRAKSEEHSSRGLGDALSLQTGIEKLQQTTLEVLDVIKRYAEPANRLSTVAEGSPIVAERMSKERKGRSRRALSDRDRTIWQIAQKAWAGRRQGIYSIATLKQIAKPVDRAFKRLGYGRISTKWEHTWKETVEYNHPLVKGYLAKLRKRMNAPNAMSRSAVTDRLPIR
jgi:hypothetical protein